MSLRAEMSKEEKLVGRQTWDHTKKAGLLSNTRYFRLTEILCFTFQSY